LSQNFSRYIPSWGFWHAARCHSRSEPAALQSPRRALRFGIAPAFRARSAAPSEADGGSRPCDSLPSRTNKDLRRHLLKLCRAAAMLSRQSPQQPRWLQCTNLLLSSAQGESWRSFLCFVPTSTSSHVQWKMIGSHEQAHLLSVTTDELMRRCHLSSMPSRCEENGAPIDDHGGWIVDTGSSLPVVVTSAALQSGLVHVHALLERPPERVLHCVDIRGKG
jgi:hypothetical protein